MVDADTLKALNELERRKRLDPTAFYEPASPKIFEFHRSSALVRALFGANRSSKTESAVQELIWHLLGKHPYLDVPPAPTYWRCVVVDYLELDKAILPKLQRMLPKSQLKGGKWELSYSERKHILTLENGSKCDFMTHEQPILAFEGTARHGTVFDEEPPKDIFVSCLMRHADYNGKTIMAMTPLKGLTWVFDDIYIPSFVKPEIESWTLSIYENKFLSHEAIEAIESLITDDIDRQIRLHGKFMSRSGLVFGAFDKAVHMYRIPEYEDDPLYEWWGSIYPPNHWPHFVGIDPGWNHPTGIIWMAIQPDNGDIWIYREHKEAGALPEDHAETIKEMNTEMGISDPIYVIDSQAKAKEQSKGDTVWNEYNENGITAILGTKKLLAGNRKLAALLRVFDGESQCHISEECMEFMQELAKYQRAKRTEMNATERFIDKDNDLISAARYAYWEASKMDADMWYEDRLNRLNQGKRPQDPQRQGSKKTGY